MISKTIIAEMSSKLAIKPRSHFLKKQGQSSLYSGSRLGFSLHKPSHVPSGTATKESLELKDYAEKMMREQRMSSQKLNQLVYTFLLNNELGVVLAADDTYNRLLSYEHREAPNPHQVSGNSQNRELSSEGNDCCKDGSSE